MCNVLHGRHRRRAGASALFVSMKSIDNHIIEIIRHGHKRRFADILCGATTWGGNPELLIFQLPNAEN